MRPTKSRKRQEARANRARPTRSVNRAAALAGLVILTLSLMPELAACRPAATSRPTRFSIPRAILVDLQPLSPHIDDPVWRRPETRRLLAAWRGQRFLAACTGSASLLDRLLHEGAALFYGPERRRANVDGIERFMSRYVSGSDALLEVRAELFAPGPSWRRPAVDACVRAARPDIAIRFVAVAAGLDGTLPMRTAMAVALLDRDGLPQVVEAWIGTRSGGVSQALLRAVGYALLGNKAADDAFAVAVRLDRGGDLPRIKRVGRYLAELQR